MLESQLELLRQRSGKPVSIGITENGEPRRSIPVPWQRDMNAYNMRTPNVYLSPGDLTVPAVRELLSGCRVVGCYVFCPTEDYGFLWDFPRLQDIHIRGGFALKSLDFLRGMEDWFQLCIWDAELPDLDALFPEGVHKGLHSYCVCFNGCTIADISALEREDIRLSELVILVPQGSNERERWQNVRCGKYTYHEYR